jgi:hypothetical protein
LRVLPALGADALDQRRFDLDGRSVAHTFALKARGDDARVVDDQRITGRKQIGKIAHGAVVEFRFCARTHHKHSRGVARVDRAKRNAIRRKVEIEQRGTHFQQSSLPGRARQSFSRQLQIKAAWMPGSSSGHDNLLRPPLPCGP